MAAKILTADEPGFSSNVLSTFEEMRTQKVVRWPLDERAEYGEEVEELAEALARL